MRSPYLPRLLLPLALLGVMAGASAVILIQKDGEDTAPAPDEAASRYDAFVTLSDIPFERNELASGKLPPADHGILFIDPVTGAGEFWTVPEARDSEGHLPLVRYDVDRTHRWLQFEGPSGRLIADRDTGATYLVTGWMAYGPTPEGRLILQTRRSTGSGAFKTTDDVPDFVLLTLGEPEKTAEFRVPGAQARSSAAALGDGRHVVVSGALVDVESGDVERFGSAAEWSPRHWAVAVGDGAAVAAESNSNSGELKVWRFDAAGSLKGEWRFQRRSSSAPVLPSPDGRWLAWQDTLPLNTFPFFDFWPTVTLIDLVTGEVAFRALRASAQVALLDLQWLSDSSGLVADSAGGFVLLTTQGTVEPLASAPRLYAPVPAWSYGVAIDGMPRVHELMMAWDDADPESRYGLFIYGFNQSGDEAYLMKEHGYQADWLIFPLRQPNLPLRVQRPPFSDEVKLRVEAGGEELNMRKGPGSSQELVGTLHDGAVVTVTNTSASPCSVEGGCSALQDVDVQASDDSPWWLHVRADNGLEGWVSADYLIWAD
jgi:hypothetical protein